MKKAQTQQMFIYIVTILIAGLILILGYSFIKGIWTNVDEAKYIEFSKSIKSDMKTGVAFGSIQTILYDVPTKYKKVCILDLGYDNDPKNTGICDDLPVNIDNYEPLACDYWEDNNIMDQEKVAVFLLPGDEEPIEVSRKVEFDGEKGFLCLPNDEGMIKLQYNGKGRSVLIKKVI